MRLEKCGDYWRIAWKDQDGRLRFKGAGAVAKVSKREAMRRLERFRSGPHAPAGLAEIKIAAFVKLFAAGKADKSDATLDQITQTGALLVACLGHHKRVASMTVSDAERFRCWLRERPGRGPEKGSTVADATVWKHMRYCRALFRRAAKMELVRTNPFEDEKASTASKSDWAQITEAQALAMIAAAPGPAWRCLIALARFNGLRAGEALALRWSNIDFDWAMIRNIDGKRGGGDKDAFRDCPLDARCRAVLAESRGRGAGPCSEISPNMNRTDTMRSIMDAARVPRYADALHTLRKNRITEAAGKYPDAVLDQWFGNTEEVRKAHYIKATAEMHAAFAGTRDAKDAEIEKLRAELAKLRPQEATTP